MRYREKGFTLIELMIAIAIVGILSSFAISTYQSSVLKSGRSDAKVTLTNLAQRQERFYSQNMSYATTMNQLVGQATLESDNGFYAITLTDATATTYTLRADAQNRQAKDEDCSWFTISHTGVEAAENANGQNCW